jgi:hypothetical protein
MGKSKLFTILTIVFIAIFILSSSLLGCNKDNKASGKLKIKPINPYTIDVRYSYSNALVTVYLSCYSGDLKILPIGNHSGVERFNNLQPNTTYCFTLIHGGILAQGYGKTLAE